MAVGHEGIAPNETAFQALAVLEHGAADVGGRTSWALLAAATLLTCTTLLRHRTWNATAIAGVLAVATLPALYLLGSSYPFMLPFGLWELLIAGHLMFCANALSWSPPIRSPPDVQVDEDHHPDASEPAGQADPSPPARSP